MRKAVLGFGMALLAGLPGQRLLAIDFCGNQSFSGVYGIVANGSVTVPGFPITGPVARAGQFISDGKGNLQINTTASYNGFIFSEPIKGTYSVAPDCTVTINTFLPNPINQPAVFNGILSDNARTLTFMISNPPGQVIRAVVKKLSAGEDDDSQGRAACSNRSLSRPSALFLQGFVINAVTGQFPGEFVRVGKFTPDGAGHFTAQTTANYEGVVIQPENFSGTYSVARDCSLSVTYTFMGQTFTWNGALINGGADLIVANPAGSAIAGTLSTQ